MFQETFKDVSKKIEGRFNGVLSGFQICLKEVKWVFVKSFKCVLRMSHRSFKGVTRKI